MHDRVKAPLRILYLEDDPVDAEVLRVTLESEGLPCAVTRVDEEREFRMSIGHGDFDLVLADYTLPDFDGISALRITREARPEIPFIFVSGTLGEERAIEALKTGATDYVLKARLARIVPSVQRALREAQERKTLSRTQEALRRSEAYLAYAQQLSHTGSFGWDVSSGTIYWSRETFRIFGYEYPAEITVRHVLERTHPEDAEMVQQVIARVSRDRIGFDFEHRLLMPDGSIKYLRVVGHRSSNEAGGLEFVGAVTDITEQRRAQEIRVAERTRIARDLHDTLLQSFQGLMLLFQAANNCLPARPLDAKRGLERALERAERAIMEGRDAVQNLRVSTVGDLAQAINAFGEELAAQGSDAGVVSATTFRVLTQGAPQTLPPMVRDEICRIAFEALRNAFRHAQASRIEAELVYGDPVLQVLIRDDGRGIDEAILRSGGRAGHWGLAGIRERATRIGARLEIRCRPSGGTEVELIIPGPLAETF